MASFSTSGDDFDLSSLCCPITEVIMEDPCILSCDGYTYERTAIETWIRSGKRFSPVTGEGFSMPPSIIPNYDLKDAIEDLERNKCRTNSDSSSKSQGGGGEKARMSQSAGIVVPLCVYNPAKIAAEKKTEKQIVAAASKAQKRGFMGRFLSKFDMMSFGKREGIMKGGSAGSGGGGRDVEGGSSGESDFINDEHKAQLNKVKLETDKQGNRFLFEVSPSGRKVTKNSMNKFDGADYFIFAGAACNNSQEGAIRVVPTGESTTEENVDNSADEIFRMPKKVLTCASSADIPGFFCTGGLDEQVSLFRYKANEKRVQFLSSLKGIKGHVKSVSVSADASLVACGSRSGSIHLWKSKKLFSTQWRLMTKLDDVHKESQNNSEVGCVVLDPSGSRWLASGGNDWKVNLYDIETSSTVNNSSLVSLGEHRAGVTRLSAFPNGNLLASSGRDGHVKLWDTRRKRSLAEVIASDGIEISGVCFDQYGGWLLSVGLDGVMRTFDIRKFTSRVDDLQLGLRMVEKSKRTYDVGIDDEGIVAVAVDDKLKMFDTNDGWKVQEVQNSAMKVMSICSLCA